jgi:membrane-associated phospholipid phosphatase
VQDLQIWGYDALQAIQRLPSPALDAAARFLSFLGTQSFYATFLPLLFWLGPRRLALRSALLFFVSAFWNTAAKDWAGQPRPSGDRVLVLEPRNDGGLPSGHAQNAVVTWGLLARSVRASGPAWRRAARVARIALWSLPLLIGLSRLRLGVHFPHDLVAGWAIGALLLFGYLALATRFESWFERLPFAARLVLPVLAAVAMYAVHPSHSGRKSMAAFAGFGLGAVLEARFVDFEERAAWFRLALRVVLGFAGAAAVLEGATLTTPWLGAHLADWTGYGLLGLWFAFGAPWCFLRFGLAGRRNAAIRGLGQSRGPVRGPEAT